MPMENLAAFPRQEVPLITCFGSAVDQSSEPSGRWTRQVYWEMTPGKCFVFQRIPWSPRGYMHCVRQQVCARAQGLGHLLRGSSREGFFVEVRGQSPHLPNSVQALTMSRTHAYVLMSTASSSTSTMAVWCFPRLTAIFLGGR